MKITNQQYDALVNLIQSKINLSLCNANQGSKNQRIEKTNRVLKSDKIARDLLVGNQYE
jgi:hypothetical protein